MPPIPWLFCGGCYHLITARDFDCEKSLLISLSALKMIYNHQDSDQAINLLQKCTRVQLDKSKKKTEIYLIDVRILAKNLLWLIRK